MEQTRPEGQSAVIVKRPSEKSQVQVIARAGAILRALEDQSSGLSLGPHLAGVEPTRRHRERRAALAG